jgi:hypothetical protein
VNPNAVAYGKTSETLDLGKSKESVVLEENVLKPFDNPSTDASGSTKTMIKSVHESLKETAHEIDVVPDVDTSMAQEKSQGEDIPKGYFELNMPANEKDLENLNTHHEGSVSADNTVENSQSDKSMKIVSVNNDDNIFA